MIDGEGEARRETGEGEGRGEGGARGEEKGLAEKDAAGRHGMVELSTALCCVCDRTRSVLMAPAFALGPGIHPGPRHSP